MKTAFASGVALSLVVTASSGASAMQYVIDDFSAANSPAPWVFSNGAEFPGANGSLMSGPGATGAGAALAYDFSGGGSYVAMTLTLTTPLTITALGFSAKISGERTTLRVVDSTGQNLQYSVNRPLEATGVDDWYSAVVDLTTPTEVFGGAADGTLHQPIKAVSLLAGDGLQTKLVGVAGFDTIVAWDSLPATLDLTQAPTAPAVPVGAFADDLGVNIHFTTDDRALDIIAAAGFTRVRMDLGWGGVETTARVYDFSAFDALVTALASRNMKLLLILDYFNSLYPMPADAGFSTTTVPAFAAVSKAAAAHFAGKGVLYEVWNEENGGFWPPAANAAQYAELCAATIAAVHQGDPTSTVTTGGLAGFDDAFLEATLEAGAGVGANAVGVHPYRQGGGESASDDLAYMRSILAGAYATPPPAWDTEWGYSSQWYGGDAGGHDPSARALQAQRVSRELLSAWALGFPLRIYYDIRDDGTDPTNDEDNFGLIQNDYTDKPAIVAVRTLTTLMAGRTLTGFLPVGFSSLHAMLLAGASNRAVALWSDAPASVTNVSIPANVVAATDMYGTAIVPATDAGVTTVTVSEIAGPVFLTFPNPPVVNDAGSGDGGDGGDAGRATEDAGAVDSGGGGDAGAPAAGTSSGCGCNAAGAGTAGMWAFAGSALIAVGARVRRRAKVRPTRQAPHPFGPSPTGSPRASGREPRALRPLRR
jgi:hypothetical protein